MATYKTPDVYVEEVSTLPPSVAEVSTAIPAFLGYTQNLNGPSGETLAFQPVRINTMLEFTEIFGGPDMFAFSVIMGANGQVNSVNRSASEGQHRLYYSLDHYFKNGGGSCYVVSLGAYGNKSKADFEKGLAALEKEDEPTLIVLSEATTLSSTEEYYDLCVAALKQAGRLKDRFCVLDVLNSDKTGANFRFKVGSDLSYGAAYFPFLQTSLNYLYNEADVEVTIPTTASAERTFQFSSTAMKVTYTGAAADTPVIEVSAGSGTSAVEITVDNQKVTITNVGTGGKTMDKIMSVWQAMPISSSGPFKITSLSDTIKQEVLGVTSLTIDPPIGEARQSLSDLKTRNTGLYNTVKAELAKQRVILPPSPAVAGAYAATDRTRGVWKAPANIALSNVIQPMVKISSQEQDDLNVDSLSGKSINAIRSFIGKGTLIWGARTLDGNSNEWRYVSVRRLFNMVEESCKNATAFAVFEPNDASTWLKVKGMIESFLYNLWQQGALAGSTPESAYFVHVGLGKTMTPQDVLEGRMIVEIGMAAVRPAEFIILRFSHKLQEA